MWGRCDCCMYGTYESPGCIGYPRPHPNPRPFLSIGGLFGGCVKCGHPESSHRRGCF